MINELYSLAKTLDNTGIKTEKSSDLYMPLRKNKCLRIWLSDSGAVCGIEELKGELVKELKTFGNDHNSFPVFNIKQLYRVTDEAVKKRLRFLKEHNEIAIDISELKTWCIENHWIKDSSRKVERSLQRTSRELLDELGESVNSNASIICKAVHLSKLVFNEENIGFRESLEQYIFNVLPDGADRSLLLDILFSEGNAEKEHKSDLGVNLSIIIDVKEWSAYGHPVANSNTTAWINQRLLSTLKERRCDEVSNGVLDAFGDEMMNKSKGNALTAEGFADFIENNKIGDFYIAGADAVACVKSTCFNMCKSGYNVSVLSDCITSYDKKKIDEMLVYYENKGCKIICLNDLLG